MLFSSIVENPGREVVGLVLIIITYFLKKKKFVKKKFLLNNAMPTEEKIDLIVSQPISNFEKKKLKFSSFFINIKKKEYN
jgi:hypothetical protein